MLKYSNNLYNLVHNRCVAEKNGVEGVYTGKSRRTVTKFYILPSVVNILIAMVQQTAMGVVSPIIDSAQTVVPALFYAIVLLVVGYILGRITFAVVNRVLQHTRVDDYFEEEGHLELELSNLFAQLAKWVVYFVFLQQSAIVLENAGGIQQGALTSLLNRVVEWIPGVIGAVAVFLAGYGIAIYTKDRIVGAETLYADLVGKTIFFFVLYISISTALPLAGISAGLLNNILLVIVASVGLAFAIAAGWGLQEVFREEAKQYIEERDM